MPIEKLRPTFTFTEERLKDLRAAIPEAFADGKLNWETLRAALGDSIEEEDADGGADTVEHFGLFWPGKRAARRLAMTPSTGTLVPQPGLGVHEATTRNLFIEGDNLEVLKLLLKSYAGRVKLIYIDPPYNTGNDFIYPDDYSEPLDAYLRRTGQMDEAGQFLTTNTKASGRFHSNWLNMMYPRLLLARQLLREDGAIFVSIDDNEVHNLRQVMNEVFGEENFVDSIIWKKRYGGGAKEKFLVTLHEYVLFYAKDQEALDALFVPLPQESIARYYKLKDGNSETRGPYRTHPLEATKSMGDRPNLVFPIPAPDGTKVLPERQWLWSRERVMRALQNNEIEFIKGKDDKWKVHTKQYLRDENGRTREAKAFSIIDDVYSQHGTNEILDIFGDAQIFSFPKPTGLITPLLQLMTSVGNQDIVLDFFSGSCATAHAIFKLNQEDGGNRRFIMVQLPEPTNNSDYPTIADIGRERIRRVIARMEEEGRATDDGGRTTDDGRMTENGQLRLDTGQTDDGRRTTTDGQWSSVNGQEATGDERQTTVIGQPSPVAGQETTGDERRTTAPDLGFRSYRLTRSHFKAWQPYTGEDVAEVETLFTRYESPLVEGWQPDDLLAEILLLQGFPLDSHVIPLDAFTENRILRVTSEACAHDLVVCLDARLHPATVAALDLRAQAANYAADVLVCLDSALTDEDKLRLADKGQVRVI
ncbi:MAG: site-specific DNA-methyltransferase [Anaerolineae bacterium]|nr:site-specific DNA-methyltransferase [Anaerolineae bacterium]